MVAIDQVKPIYCIFAIGFDLLNAIAPDTIGHWLSNGAGAIAKNDGHRTRTGKSLSVMSGT